MWKMTEALMGGTKAMRLSGKTYLPKHPNETEESYQVRLDRSTLTNYYRATVRHLTGKAFAKPLALGKDVPPKIAEWCEDVDLAGQHISVFASSLLQHGLAYGKGYILVDYPRVAAGLTMEEERRLKARPYFVFVPCQNVLGIRFSEDGTQMLQARLLETRIVADGEWGEREAVFVRVLVPGGYFLYEQARDKSADKAGWVLVDEGRMAIDEIPLVQFFANKPESRFSVTPPLEDLAYLNVAHWQSASDQRNVLTVARFPMLAASGWTSDDPEIAIGPKKLLATENPQGKFYYVEHSGAAIAAGRQDLEDLKVEMAAMGLQMLMPQATGIAATATENQIKYAESTSTLRMSANNLCDAVENALMLMAKWGGIEDGGSVSLDGNFELSGATAEILATLNTMRQSGELSRKTYWAELKRRGILSDEFDADAESDLLSVEPPGGGGFGGGE